jgi:hypothetical protein
MKIFERIYQYILFIAKKKRDIFDNFLIQFVDYSYYYYFDNGILFYIV